MQVAIELVRKNTFVLWIDNVEKSQVHHCRDTAICNTSFKTQKQKFGENKHWLKRITHGDNVQKNRWRDNVL